MFNYNLLLHFKKKYTTHTCKLLNSLKQQWQRNLHCFDIARKINWSNSIECIHFTAFCAFVPSVTSYGWSYWYTLCYVEIMAFSHDLFGAWDSFISNPYTKTNQIDEEALNQSMADIIISEGQFESIKESYENSKAESIKVLALCFVAVCFGQLFIRQTNKLSRNRLK